MKNTLFEHISGNQFRLKESKLPFTSQIAKSIYDYHIQNKGVTTDAGENAFTFYRKATDKQAHYVNGASGYFFGNDGRFVRFPRLGELQFVLCHGPKELGQMKKRNIDNLKIFKIDF